MAWYRFTDPVRQTNFVQFGLNIGLVCEHLLRYPDGTQPSGHIEITDIRLRTNKLAFNTTANIPAEEVPHLSLEAG